MLFAAGRVTVPVCGQGRGREDASENKAVLCPWQCYHGVVSAFTDASIISGHV